ncbi:MAG TPA: dihydrodipicolinate synthase family protein, partial [Sphingopyxis terrae]|nr:dihydrodipicolinate synthase family protein [Sphingopyxis terrae]
DFAAACAAGDWARALVLHDRLFPLHKAMFTDASPAPVKYALSRVHDWFSPDVRLPIIPASAASRAAVDAALVSAGVL